MQSVHDKVYHYNDKLWDNLEPTVHFTMKGLSPVADEVTKRVDSAGDLEEDELSSVGSLYFEDSGEDESDPRVQEEVSVVEMMAFPITLRYVTS